MAFTNVYQIYGFLNEYDEESAENQANNGVKALAFSLLMGIAGYLSGHALSLRADDIL